MRKISWGILSTAKIGLTKVIPALQRSQLGTVVALASRDTARAASAAATLGIPRVHDSYEALLADPAVDAVYLPLPNHLHVPWAGRALAAGKHVLCEKPIALTAAEAQQLADTAARHPQLKIMEAFMYRFHPQWIRARELVASGAIGELRHVHTHFSYFNVDAANIRNRADLGGGALMDIGCYAVSFARTLFAAEPTRVRSLVDRDPAFGTDRITSALLEFPSGSASLTCSTQLTPFQRTQVFGTAGRLEIEIPVNAPPDKPTRLWLQRTNTPAEEIAFPAVDQYSLQADAFARAILDDTPVPTPLTDAVANMRVIESIFAAAQPTSP